MEINFLKNLKLFKLKIFLEKKLITLQKLSWADLGLLEKYDQQS